MPQFDLRNIYVAQYNNNAGTVTYSNGTSIGDAMGVDLNLRFAEGRLYAESRLAEFLKKCTGGTISIAEKYIPTAAQKLLFGATDKSRTVSSTTCSGLVYSSKDVQKNVGVAFFAPDMVDGEEKYTCVLIHRAKFGPPSMSLKTMGENIQFATPTCSGEFMPDHSSASKYMEVAVVDTEALAIAWVKQALSIE